MANTPLIHYVREKCRGIPARRLKQQSHEAIYCRKIQIIRSLGLVVGANRFFNEGIDRYDRTVSNQRFWVSNILEVVQGRNYRVELGWYLSGLPFLKLGPEAVNVVPISTTVLRDFLMRI